MTQFIKTLIKTHKNNEQLDEETRVLLFKEAIDNMMPDTSLRDVLTLTVLHHASHPLSPNLLEQVRTQVGELAGLDTSKVNPTPTMEEVVLLPSNKDLTLEELGQKLNNSQLHRFIEETFHQDSLDYTVDQLDHPHKHAKGFFQKAILRMTLGVAHKMDKHLMRAAILEQMQFNWKDDGATNKNFETFLTRRALEQKNKEKQKQKSSMKM